MNMRKIYRKIAKEHNVSVQEVKEEMQKAIDQAWTNPDKTVEQMAMQREVHAKGEIPTVEEFIQFAKRKLT